MTILEQFIEDRLDMVKKHSSDAEFQENLFCQAFGAVEFACLIYPKYEDEIGEWWNYSKRNEFRDAIGG